LYKTTFTWAINYNIMSKLFYLPAALLFLLSSCKKKQEKIQPTIENITESVYASGIVKSNQQYHVFSKASGIIKQILVTEGDKVKKGDTVIIILNETATLNTENAQLTADFAANNAAGDKLTELKINIDQAKNKLDNDASLVERQRNLYNQNIGTRNELEQRELSLKNSTTAYNAAKLRYNDLKKQLEFNLQQSKKNVAISSSISKDFIIRSEMDGKVYSVLKEQGEMVNTQSPVAIIGDANDFKLELQVDEYDIAKIKPGQKVLLSMDSYKGQVFEATVSKINPLMNERSRSFTIDAVFVNKPPALYPNLTTEANIVLLTKEKVLTIPRAYLIDDNFVLMEKDKKVKVTTGLKDYQKVEILGGINAGDFIFKPTK